jgi:hypothetical protein
MGAFFVEFIDTGTVMAIRNTLKYLMRISSQECDDRNLLCKNI